MEMEKKMSVTHDKGHEPVPSQDSFQQWDVGVWMSQESLVGVFYSVIYFYDKK